MGTQLGRRWSCATGSTGAIQGAALGPHGGQSWACALPRRGQHRGHTVGSVVATPRAAPSHAVTSIGTTPWAALAPYPEPCHGQSPLPCFSCPGCAHPRCQHRTVPVAAGQDTPGQPVPAPQVLLGPPYVGHGEIKERLPPLPAGTAGSERVPWAPARRCQPLRAWARLASPWGQPGLSSPRAGGTSPPPASPMGTSPRVGVGVFSASLH